MLANNTTRKHIPPKLDLLLSSPSRSCSSLDGSKCSTPSGMRDIIDVSTVSFHRPVVLVVGVVVVVVVV